MRVSQSAAAAAVLALSLAPVPAPAQGLDDVQIEATRLSDHVSMLTGQGGNLGVSIGPDGVFLIDDQFAALNEKILAKIAELAAEGDRTDRTFLVNTHFHADHTGGNELIGGRGGVIVAHDNVRTRLAVEQVVPFFGMRNPPLRNAGLPVITFETDVTLHLNGDEIHVFHVGPAHTDGDAVVHFRQANIIHAGDIAFIGTYPFIDLDNGGSVAGVLAAIDRIAALCDDGTKIIPGHGPLIDKAAFEAYGAMLRDVYGSVRTLVEEGRTLEEVLAAKPTAAYDAEWSTFVTAERFLGLLYRDLTAN